LKQGRIFALPLFKQSNQSLSTNIQQMPHILLLRFSAMGDVVLTLPVVQGLVRTYPDVQVTVVTRPQFAVFFEGIERVTVFSAAVDTVYKGVVGLFRLFRALSTVKYAAVIDLHSHLRTQILRTFFRVSGTKVVVFDKGRAEKRALTRRQNKVFANLPHTTARYAAACAEAGFPIILPMPPLFATSAFANETVDNWLGNLPLGTKKIGIAPFAKHAPKQWGIERIAPLITQLLLAEPTAQLFLFGGGASETAQLQSIAAQFPKNCRVVAGTLPLTAELALMTRLDAMLCMDSANLHLAAMAGTRTVSVWGATHPAAGFGAYGDPLRHKIVQISTAELPCRPCSVFGNAPCFRGDMACMQRIEVAQVAAALLALAQ
jgi:ADP-heptose:LPS heptosyltransferase